MKKKITNEDIGEFIGKLADQVRSDMDFDFRVAYGQMGLAETDLVHTLDEKQRELYKEFCKKREEFYNIARELYQRKF